MTTDSTARWEWRGLAETFDELNECMPPEFEMSYDIYVLAPESPSTIRIRDDVLDVHRLLALQGPLELWSCGDANVFPLCQREIREALRGIGVLPPTVFRPQFTVLQFLTEVASCTNGLRVIGVQSTTHRATVDGCAVERATLTAAGQVLQTAMIAAPQPSSIMRLLERFNLTRRSNINLPSVLKQLLRMPSTAPPAIAEVSTAPAREFPRIH